MPCPLTLSQAVILCDTKPLRSRDLLMIRNRCVEIASSWYLLLGVVWQTGGGVEV